MKVNREIQGDYYRVIKSKHIEKAGFVRRNNFKFIQLN